MEAKLECDQADPIYIIDCGLPAPLKTDHSYDLDGRSLDAKRPKKVFAPVSSSPCR